MARRPKGTLKLILIRFPLLLFYKMKSKEEDKNMTTDTITGNVSLSAITDF